MHKTKVLGLDAFKSNTTKMLTDYWVNEQSRRLVEYAKEKIIQIGDKIKSYHSRNHMDRTGNLLNSLCWIVTYNGKMVERGFYRNANALSESYLHEFFDTDTRELNPVDGHERAYVFTRRYANNAGNGWHVAFAILAPYWAYWERGFTMVHGFSNNRGESKFRGATWMQFSVMTEVYDTVRGELKLTKTKFSIPKVTYNTRKGDNLENQKRRIAESPWYEKRHFSRRPQNRKNRTKW